MAKTAVAVVTGGAQGMGAEHVRGLLAAGFRVAAIDRNAEALSTFARRVGANGEELTTHLCDVTVENEVTATFAQILRQRERIDALVNNAGGALHGATLAATTLDDWNSTLRLNLTSQFLCIRAVLPAMQAQGGGSIVNIATASAFSGITAALYKGGDTGNLVAYVAAKGGVVGMTHALARELGPTGIRVNAVAPGFTPTDRVRASFPREAVHRMVADQAFRRIQETGDATGAVVFLASDAARFVTGQVLRVDGGGSMG